MQPKTVTYSETLESNKIQTLMMTALGEEERKTTAEDMMPLVEENITTKMTMY